MKVRKVTVNVCENDSVDIRCGGPQHLGFDFYVDPKEDPKDLKGFLFKKLKEVGIDDVEFFNISKPIEIPIKKLWTRLMMTRCINKDGPGMVPLH